MQYVFGSSTKCTMSPKSDLIYDIIILKVQVELLKVIL